MAAGRFTPRVEEAPSPSPRTESSSPNTLPRIAEFRGRQAAAFAAERAAWEAAGEFARAEAASSPAAPPPELEVPPGGQVVEAEFAASVWQVNVAAGDAVPAGQPLLALEAMKMESRIPAPRDATVSQILVAPGTQVEAGTALLVLGPV